MSTFEQVVDLANAIDNECRNQILSDPLLAPRHSEVEEAALAVRHLMEMCDSLAKHHPATLATLDLHLVRVADALGVPHHNTTHGKA